MSSCSDGTLDLGPVRTMNGSCGSPIAHSASRALVSNCSYSFENR